MEMIGKKTITDDIFFKLTNVDEKQIFIQNSGYAFEHIKNNATWITQNDVLAELKTNYSDSISGRVKLNFARRV